VQYQHCFKSFCHDAVGTTTLTVTKKTMVASGFTHVPPAAAVVLAPTSLGFDEATGTRYVASTADNAIYAVTHAGNASGAPGLDRIVFSDAHLRGPLALRLAPNRHLLTANGDAVNGDPLRFRAKLWSSPRTGTLSGNTRWTQVRVAPSASTPV
jgi:hypothetical protein